MPELPEVETIVNGLKQEVLHRTFVDIWTDTPSLIKHPKFEQFKKILIGKKIKDVKRRAKNILICLDEDYVLLVHQKMTGHLMVGEWIKEKSKWLSKLKGSLADDPMNAFLHLILFLNSKQQLALSDVRKFAKVELWKKEELLNSKEFSSIGPEPLDIDFTFEKFENLFIKKKGNIKQVLMDQSFIAGIGNIYASEILFEAKIDPQSRVENLDKKDLKIVYKAIQKILKKGIEAHGASLSDFRDIHGEKGGFQKIAKVYAKEGQKCPSCGGTIKRITIGQRGTFFCPKCQIIK
jgi:formamidopyrimidine-DNA glycosylase